MVTLVAIIVTLVVGVLVHAGGCHCCVNGCCDNHVLTVVIVVLILCGVVCCDNHVLTVVIVVLILCGVVCGGPHGMGVEQWWDVCSGGGGG